MAISKQFHVPLNKAANIIKTFKAHGTVANLHAHGCNKEIDPSFNGRIVWKVDTKSQKAKDTSEDRTSCP